MPNTPRGKARSRMNALKHGLRATDELFLAHLKPNEREIFEEFRASLHSEYHPQTDHEKLLVDCIAIQHLRLFRLYRLEYTAENQSASLPLSADSVIKHLDRFSRYDWRIERQLRILHNRLRTFYCMRGEYSLKSFPTKE